jgi:hypothetical protein
MKSLLCIVFLSLSSFMLQAQLKEVAASESFEEPRDGALKIIQTDDGNTFYINHHMKEGLIIKKYNAQHKLVKTNTIFSNLAKLHREDQLLLYFRNNTLVILATERMSRGPKLYRQIIDANTLALKEEVIVDELPKMKLKFGFNYSRSVYDRELKYYAQLDTASGSYIALVMNTDEEAGKQIKVMHFNQDHEQINTAYFSVPNSNYDYIDLMDYYVNADKEVVVLAKGVQNKNEELLLGLLKKGENTFRIRKPTFVKAKELETSVIRFNASTNQYIILCYEKVGQRGNLLRAFWNADTDEESTQQITGLTLPKPDNVKKGDNYGVILNDYILNADGSFNLLLQDYIARTETVNNTKSSFTTVRIFNNDVRYLEFNTAAELTHQFKMDLAYQRFNTLTFRLDNKVSDAGVSLNAGVQFKNVLFVNGQQKKYIIFNDDEKNQQRIDEKDDATIVRGLENCIAYMHPVKEGNKVKREPLFNDEISRKNRPLVIAAASAYNKNTNKIAMLKVNFKNKTAQMVWLEAE